MCAKFDAFTRFVTIFPLTDRTISEMHGDPILFFDKSLPLLVLCTLSKNKKILNVRSFNFIAISTQIRSNFNTNVGLHDLQLSFYEANFT